MAFTTPNPVKTGAGEPTCLLLGTFGAKDLAEIQGTFKPQPDS